MADALWRATVYVSVCQLHLCDNVLLTDPLAAEHVKKSPTGHWGTVPGTAWALTHVALASGQCDARMLIPLLGAGHAGVVQLSVNWLTGQLAEIRPKFSLDAPGLAALASGFPDVDGLGAETCPGLFAGDFLGGRLGGCLPFAQGAGLESPGRITVPVIGDGECETPTTAASWLAHAALGATKVLPIVHVNGYRMGATSLLGTLTDDGLRAWAEGLGWHAAVVSVDNGSLEEHTRFHEALLNAVATVDRGQPMMVLLRCLKGWGGPSMVGGRAVLGTANAHKTPLTEARTDEDQRDLLSTWLASYRPAELFDIRGRPRGVLAESLSAGHWHCLSSAPDEAGIALPSVDGEAIHSAADAVLQVVSSWAAGGGFRVFSPDELGSNRLGAMVDMPFVNEVLAEEVLLEWMAGWTASGRRGILISYEAFASLMVPGLISYLKQRRLATSPRLPSLNVLLTSYGWHNTYTHGDPSAMTALLGTCDPSLRVLTPADPLRLAVTLNSCLASTGRVNIVIAGKHDAARFAVDTLEAEIVEGLAMWPQLSDPGEPDLTIVTAGDLPARTVAGCVTELRVQHRCRIRVVNLADLTVLGSPAIWPHGLSDAGINRHLGTDAAVLIVTLGHPAAVWGLLQGRLQRPVEVIGWREPSSPLPQTVLAGRAGLDPAGMSAATGRLLNRRGAER
jgi:xylulose-5-phosphate/fructose-6-phosphate phosphoketolase